MRNQGSLTRRERMLIRTMLQGHTDVESLARELSISKRTVQTHLSNIYSKLGINNKAALVLLAVRGVAEE